MPKTEEWKCRYVRLIRGQGQTDEHGRQFCGRARAFVSHSWDSEWSALVDAIGAHSDRWVHEHPDEPEPPYYWIDIFAINQHSGTDESNDDMPGWDSMAPDRGFQRVIDRAGLVLALQDRWDDPRIVHRVWCLYEMTTALSSDDGPSRVPTSERGFHRVEGIIGGADLRDMRARIGGEGTLGAIEEQIGRIDVSTANATNPEDKVKIFALIECAGGCEQLNERVRAMQRRLLVEHARRMVDQRWTTEELRAEHWLTLALARHGGLLPWAKGFSIVVMIAGFGLLAYSLYELFFNEVLILGVQAGSGGLLLFAAILGIIAQRLETARLRRLGPARHANLAAVSVLTREIVFGVACNFVVPIALALGPWASLLVDRSAGGRETNDKLTMQLVAAAGCIPPFGSGFVFFVALLVYGSSSGMETRANFMLKVAQLAHGSAMLDVAETCLHDCLKLCGRHGNVFSAMKAHSRLAAVMVRSGRMAEAKAHESAMHGLCAAQLTGWRGFLRTYVSSEAPRSLLGLAHEHEDPGLRAAYYLAELYAGLQDADAAVAELARACEMGLDGIESDALFEVVRLQRPEEFARLEARISENVRQRRYARVWRGRLFALTLLGMFASLFSAMLFLQATSCACADVDADATDCPLWAQAGECTRNPAYMTEFCTKSCKVCSGGSLCGALALDSPVCTVRAGGLCRRVLLSR